MFWEGIFRGIIGAIDGTIYWFIELLLQLVLDLANTQIFSQSVINEFANRIYIILGLVMLFKIIISFIQILINPDKMDDKEQGVGNILMRVVISLILIVLVPSIFSLARQIQSYVIPVIPKVILGSTAGSIDDGTSEEFMATGGRAMAFYTYTAFFNYSDPACVDGSIYGTGNDPTAVVVYDIGSAVDHIDEVCDATGGYKYSHGFPMSTIVGIFLIFMLVQISIAIAIRAIKLGICEFIAPIPIASYIDPKTSKQAFDNWVSTSIKTYLDLFSRLIIVYFVVFVFMTIVSDESLDTITANLGGDTTRQSLVIVALIIGLLQFAKQAPKFISDMLGVKDGMGDIGGMFKGAGAMAAAVGGAGIAGLGNIVNARRSGQSWVKAIGSGVAGWTSGMYYGNRAALSGKGSKDAFNASTQTPWRRRNLRAADSFNNVKLRDRMRAATLDWAQINDDISLAEGQQKAISTLRGDIASSKKATFGRIDKTGDISFHGLHNFGQSKTIQDLGELMYDNWDFNTWNNELKNIFSKFDYQMTKDGKKQWKIKDGEKFSYHDLTAIARNAEQSGVGSLASALGENGYLKLGAQKEIHDNTTKGNATNSAGDKYMKFMEHPDIVFAKENSHQDVAKLFAEIGPMSFDYTDATGKKMTFKIENAKQMMDAIDQHQAEFDDALSRKASDLNKEVSTNATAAGRASNQRWKNSGK